VKYKSTRNHNQQILVFSLRKTKKELFAQQLVKSWLSAPWRA